MSSSSLPLRTTARLQQIARTSTQLSYRRVSSIQTRKYSKTTDAIMGAQKTDTREGYAQTPLNTIKVYKHRGDTYRPSPLQDLNQLTHSSRLRLPNYPLHLRFDTCLPRLLHIHRLRRRPNTNKPTLNRRTRPLRSLLRSTLPPFFPGVCTPCRPQSSLGPLPPRQRSNDATPCDHQIQRRRHQSMHLLYKSRRPSPKLHTQWPLPKLSLCSHPRCRKSNHVARRKRIRHAFTH